MSFPRISSAVLLVVLAGAVCAVGQQNGQSVAPQGHPVPSGEQVLPFSTDGTIPLTVELRPADAMSQKDKDLEAGAESVIREKAGFEDLGFNEQGWTYSQLVCPAFPNHLLLRFARGGNTSERSMFSASIPRNPDGQVRVIPIVRQGYSLFSPAPVNAIGLGALRHMLAEEGGEKKDFGAVAVCYAALTGAPVNDTSGRQVIQAATQPALSLASDGSSKLSFSTSGSRRIRYELEFDREGRPIKGSHSAEDSATFQHVSSHHSDSQGHVVPAGKPLQEKSIPPAKEAVWKPVPQGAQRTANASSDAH